MDELFFFLLLMAHLSWLKRSLISSSHIAILHTFKRIPHALFGRNGNHYSLKKGHVDAGQQRWKEKFLKTFGQQVGMLLVCANMDHSDDFVGD